MIAIACSLALLCGADEGAPVALKMARLDARQRQLATVCLQGWKEVRDRLRSGVFSARGHQFALGTGQYPDLDVPSDIYCAFDYDRDLFRYDGRTQQRVAAGDGPQRTKGDSQAVAFEERDVMEKFSRGPKQAITWCSVNPRTVGFHSLPFSFRGKAMLPPLDVRIVGLALWRSVDSGSDYSDQCRSFSEWEMEEAADEGGGQYRCVWVHIRGEFRKEEVRHRVWFDQRKGLSPVRSEVRITRAAIAGLPAEEFLQQESHATWISINGVWVPKTFSIRLIRDGRSRNSRDLTFDWRSVNEPVGGQLFELAGMNLPRQARIIDHRLTTPAIVGRVEDFEVGPPAPPVPR